MNTSEKAVKFYNLSLFADYHQFYLQDEQADGDLSDQWTPEAIKRLMAVASGTIGVGTVRNTRVPVFVEIIELEPEDDLSQWDQVNECSIEIASGRIVIAVCTDYFPDDERIEVSPGYYRARVRYGGLDSVSENGADEQDCYSISLWPSEKLDLTVLKQWSGFKS